MSEKQQKAVRRALRRVVGPELETAVRNQGAGLSGLRLEVVGALRLLDTERLERMKRDEGLDVRLNDIATCLGRLEGRIAAVETATRSVWARLGFK